MLSKLFNKPADIRPRFEQDATLAEALIRRVNAIEFQPSRGFLKDQWQQKRAPNEQYDSVVTMQRDNDFARHLSQQTN